MAKSLQDLLGDLPSQARMALVAAQGQVTREGLLKAVNALDEKAFESVSALESFASKTEDNSEESVDAKRKEILGGIEDYRARVQLAIERLEALTAFTAPVQSGHAPSQGSQPRVEPENKFTPQYSKVPEDLPPRAECNPKSFADCWKDALLYLESCYSRPPSDKDYCKKIWMFLDSSWRDLLKADYTKCTLQELHKEIQEEILRSYPTYRRRCSFFSIPQKTPQKAAETPGQVLTRVRLEAAVSAVGEERVTHCPSCTCEKRCVTVGSQDMTYSASVTSVWLASLRQEVQQKVFEHFAHNPKASDKELQSFATVLDDLALAFKPKGAVHSVTSRGRKQAGGQGDKKRTASEGGKNPRAASAGDKSVRGGEPCSYCKQTNHASNRCWRDPSSPWFRPNLAKKVSTVSKEASPAEKVEGSVNSLSLSSRKGVISSLAATPRPTPRLAGSIAWEGGSVSCPLFPDTGSCVSLVHEDTVASWGVEIRQGDFSNYGLTSFTGQDVGIKGTVLVEVSLEADSGTVSTTLFNTNSDQMPYGEVLIGWETLTGLGLFTVPESPTTQQTGVPMIAMVRRENKEFLDRLAKNPPMRTFAEVETGDPEYEMKIEKGCEEVLQALLQDFPLAFAEHLSLSTYIDSEPVRVCVKEGAVPVSCSVCFPYPKGREGQCRALENELLSSTTIVKYNKPTLWTHQGFFIPKGPEKVRLVVDLKSLNLETSRIGYPMTSSKDIFRQIPHHAKVFISFDLLHSFFQVRVAEEDWHLLSFVIPSGKFCFTRLIQGHLNSGDHLNMESQCLLVCLRDALQIMDDFMSACSSLQDAYIKGSVLLQNAVR